MKIKIDDSEIRFFVTLILKVKNGDLIKFEIYQTIIKETKNPEEATNIGLLQAQTKFTIKEIVAKSVHMLSPKIFLD